MRSHYPKKFSLISDLVRLVDCPSSIRKAEYEDVIRLSSELGARYLGKTCKIQILREELDPSSLREYLSDLIRENELISSDDPLKMVWKVNLIPRRSLIYNFTPMILRIDVNGGGNVILHTHVDTLLEGRASLGKGYVKGPGSADGKGGLISIFEGLRKILKRKEDIKVTILATTEEERGGLMGLAYFVRKIRLHEFRGCLSLTGYLSKAAIGNLGTAWLLLKGNMPDPASIKYGDSYFRIKEVYHTTETENKSVSIIQVTYLAEKPKYFLEEISSILGAEDYIGVPPAIPSSIEDCPFISKVLYALKSHPIISLPCDIRFLIRRGLPSVAYGPMRRESMIHTINERVLLKDIDYCAKKIASLLTILDN
jgi:acetylornithine deacetylase/succinyl-diaminopimelate desuccinylase-like protein